MPRTFVHILEVTSDRIKVNYWWIWYTFWMMSKTYLPFVQNLALSLMTNWLIIFNQWDHNPLKNLLKDFHSITDCRDFDAKMCQKIIFWFGHKACKDQQNTRHYTKDLSRICPKSCGLCGKLKTKDKINLCSLALLERRRTGKGKIYPL